jgi:hypothetical protein
MSKNKKTVGRFFTAWRLDETAVSPVIPRITL